MTDLETWISEQLEQAPPVDEATADRLARLLALGSKGAQP